MWQVSRTTSLPVGRPARAAEALSLWNTDLRIGPLIHMDSLDKPHLALVQLHHQGGGAYAIAEEAHPLEQRPVGDSGGREDDVLARRQVVRGIDTLGVGD